MSNDWMSMRTVAEKSTMRKNAKLSRYTTMIVLWLFEMAAVSFLILKSYDRSKELRLFKQGKINASDRRRPMYLQSEFTYDVQKTPYYEITWILQFLTTLFAGSTSAAIDGFFSAVVLHLCAQMKNLRGQLDDTMSKAAMRQDKSETLKLSVIVERHKYLMWFAQTIEDIFNLQFLIQLLTSIVIFCLTGYQIVLITTKETISMLEVLYAVYIYLCFAGSLFLYCLFAMVVSTESMKLGETAYNGDWYELSSSKAKLLILIMMRTTKPFELTAGKFVAFSLPLYCSVVKTSGGYLSMLLAVRSRLSDD